MWFCKNYLNLTFIFRHTIVHIFHTTKVYLDDGGPVTLRLLLCKPWKGKKYRGKEVYHWLVLLLHCVLRIEFIVVVIDKCSINHSDNKSRMSLKKNQCKHLNIFPPLLKVDMLMNFFFTKFVKIRSENRSNKHDKRNATWCCRKCS
jgi:hypothetical protein